MSRRARPAFASALLVAAVLLVPPTAATARPSEGWPALVVVHPAAAALNGNLSGAWTSVPYEEDQPFDRSDAALAWDTGRGLGVVFGGRGAAGAVLNDTLVNDGDHVSYWAIAPDAINRSPPPLLDAAITYDPDTNGFVQFGGLLANGSAYGRTWEFSSFQWTDVTPTLATAPPPDAGASLAYDATDGYAVLLSSSGATWAFHANGWSRMAPAHSPPVRSGAAAASDLAGGGIVLFGGVSAGANPHPLNDTWRFVGGDWHPLDLGVAPPPQDRPAMAYDPRLPGMLLQSSSGSVLTWTFVGGAWSPIPAPGAGPSARTGAELYFDSNALCDVLFGGIAANGTTFGDAWEWSLPPPPPDPTIGAAAISGSTWIELAALVVIPIAIALLLRRRPPRTSPTDVPASAAAAAPG